MSLASILESISQDSSAEAARVVAAAEAEATKIRETARADADRRLAAAVAAAEPALQAEAARVVNAARLGLLRRRAEAASARQEAAWNLANDRLLRIAAESGERWRHALTALTVEALGMAGPAAIVRARAADAAVIEPNVETNGGRIEIAADGGSPGPWVSSVDGRIEIDATIRARMARARHTLTVD